MIDVNTSKYIGGILIVAGTTIGAGMLALPIAASGLGFFGATILMFVMWALMTYTAIVTMNINLNFKNSLSIAKLAQKTLGRKAGFVGLLSLLFLFYSLLAAYTAGASSIIAKSLPINYQQQIPHGAIQTIYTIVFGGIISLSMQSVDISNRVMFSVKIILFMLLAYLLFSHVSMENISQPIIEIKSIWIAIPLFFTSFGFHGSIPVIIKYIDNKNYSQLRKVFIIGSLIPIIVYIIWLFIALGSLPYFGEKQSFQAVIQNDGDLGVFVTQLGSISNNTLFMLIVNSFMLLAIITSFLGVGAGLLDLIKETLELKKTTTQKTIASIITFLFPLLFAIFYPNGFVKALSFAAIFLSILAVIIPTLIAIKLKNKSYQIYISLFMGIGIIIIALLFR